MSHDGNPSHGPPSLSQQIVRKRRRINRIVTGLSVFATAAGLFLLAWILGYLLFKGFTTLSLGAVHAWTRRRRAAPAA